MLWPSLLALMSDRPSVVAAAEHAARVVIGAAQWPEVWISGAAAGVVGGGAVGGGVGGRPNATTPCPLQSTAAEYSQTGPAKPASQVHAIAVSDP